MIKTKKLNNQASYSYFQNKTGENSEYFLAIHPKHTDLEKALLEISKIYKVFLKEARLTKESQIFSRFFLSDIENQKKILLSSKMLIASMGVFSIVGESPLNGSGISMFSYHINGNFKFEPVLLNQSSWSNSIKFIGHDYQLVYTANLTASVPFNSELQTKAIFNAYTKALSGMDQTLSDNCIRTWIYIRDIDNHYNGMVKARREYFEKHGLTKDTHFIASTGIEGKGHNTSSLVSMDAISIANLRPEQIIRMEARTHLNPTHEYGVTFERGSRIDFGDRSHLYISGTASIDNKGQVLYPRNIKKQTYRILENIRALLKPHKASLSDITYLIVYLRNINDTASVKKVLEKEDFGKLPTFFVNGAVCRSDWLVEIECFAIKQNNSNWPNFF